MSEHNKKSSIANLIGQSFDQKYLLSKVKRDFSRLKNPGGVLEFYDTIMDFSNSIKHLAEWHWHETASYVPEWQGRSFSEFIQHLRQASPEFAAFDDIANTFKHHTRWKENELSKHVKLHIDFEGVITNPTLVGDCLKWSFGTPPKPLNVLVTLVTPNGDYYRLFYSAEKAIKFWSTKIGS